MKFKKVLSIILAFVMILGSFSVCAEGVENITVYLSVSKYGELVTDKYGNTFACVEIELDGKESYNLNDVFFTAHSLYCEDGEEGYASSVGQWGFGIDKFWSDTSYNFGYQVNGGTESVSGLDYTVKSGDFIDAFIYKNQYPETEGYAMFDKRRISLYTNNECDLTLEYFSGYDENWNSIVSPCEDATVIINGEETEYRTDGNGQVVLSFENEGTYIVSARKTKLSGDNEVPAITAPSCVIDVKITPEIEILHNIARQYKTFDFSHSDSNLPWVVADMITYEELFPQSGNILDDDQKESAKKTIATDLIDAERPGDLAKGILALRALGYDAKNIYTKVFKMVDAVKKLTDLVDAKDESVTNIYTIPYVLIALLQDDSYATQEQIDWLIQSIKDSKDIWQNVEYGTDALTPILLALSPYYETDSEIKSLCNETIEILKQEQRDDGLIDGFEGYESASTGLSICALSSLGIDSSEVKKSEKSLIAGLLSTANSELNGFSNAFATEQGFRGLLAFKLLSEEERIYDFKDNTVNEANISDIENCPVEFKVIPSNAEVRLDGVEKVKDNLYDLTDGTYRYSVSASGYETTSGEFVISEEDLQNHTLKTVNISLSQIYSGGGGVSRPVTDNKEDSKKEENEEIKPEVNVDDTKTDEFNENTFSDVSSDDWYYSAVKYVYENKLFNGTDKGFEPESSMTRAMLVTVLHRLDSSKESKTHSLFSDVPKDTWYTKSVNWALDNKIVNGISEDRFAPDSEITREQLAVILYRYAVYNGYDVSLASTKISDFSDKEKISPYAVDAMNYITSIGVLNGREENILAPQDKVKRAEVAIMLKRFAEVKK